MMRNVLAPKARDWAVSLASSQVRVGRNCQLGQYICCPSRGANKDGVPVCSAQKKCHFTPRRGESFRIKRLGGLAVIMTLLTTGPLF